MPKSAAYLENLQKSAPFPGIVQKDTQMKQGTEAKKESQKSSQQLQQLQQLQQQSNKTSDSFKMGFRKPGNFSFSLKRNLLSIQYYKYNQRKSLGYQ